MKLLLDENLSPLLIAAPSDLYPGSVHVEHCGLMSASDDEVWRFARENDFMIVTKDSDFGTLRSGGMATQGNLASYRKLHHVARSYCAS